MGIEFKAAWHFEFILIRDETIFETPVKFYLINTKTYKIMEILLYEIINKY